MQLHTAMVLAGPQVRQRPAKLGMPHQRRHVIEDDGHADVVHRAVGRDPDRPVDRRLAAEQPQVPGASEVDRGVEVDRGAWHGPYRMRVRLWKLIGLAGLAGVAATGVVIARAERRRRAYTPEEIRARLHERAVAATERSHPQ